MVGVPLPAAVVIAALALAVSGCGSSDEPDVSSTESWADGVCSSLVTWQESITTTVGSLQDGNLSVEALQDAAGEAKDATSTLASDLKALGKPDTDAGDQAESTINELADSLSSGADEIESTVGDVSGLSGIVGAVSSVTATLGSMGTAITTAFGELEDLDPKGELESAFSQASSCSAITGS